MEQETTVTHTILEEELGKTFDPTSSSGLKDTQESEKLDTKSTHSDSDDDNCINQDEDDFTFACVADNELSFAAEDMFDNGKIKPIFPLFDQNLVNPYPLPPIKKVFVTAGVPPPPTQTAAEGSWLHKASFGNAAEVNPTASPEACKKSNSTGFSKIWQFKEMSTRSHSDGRDAFVFLKKLESKKKMKDSATVAVEKSAAIVATKKKGGGKGKEMATAISVHEAYVKSRTAAVREEDRRRPYLQYKPVGFFTNIHGGMTKNVHPF